MFIQYGKGARVSIYYEETAKALFAKLGIKPDVSITPNQITIVIPEDEVQNARTQDI